MIPIYRAKKIDNDEYVEGYYFKQMFTNLDDKLHLIHTFSKQVGHTSVKIDPSTLAISFNRGKTWYSDFENINYICNEHLPETKD